MRTSRAALIAVFAVAVSSFILITVLCGSAEKATKDGPQPTANTYAGKTAGEWEALARNALAGGRLNRALSHIKSAEGVEPGTQYAAELSEIRSARWRARQIEANRNRLFGGEIERLEFDDAGKVTVAHRSAVALPGESLWCLARACVAAERGVLAADVSGDDGSIDRYWDLLTDLNGVRELEIGEFVKVPLTPEERTGIEAVNNDELAKLAAAAAALNAGDLTVARKTHDEIRGAFVTATFEYVDLGEELAAAERAELARSLRNESLEAAKEGRFARADSLAREALSRGADASLVGEVDEAREALGAELATLARDLYEEAQQMSRLDQHGDMLDALTRARDNLLEAERLFDGSQYKQPLKALEPLLSEAQSIRIMEDGTVAARKKPGVPYTAAAKAAVEWLLRRELVASGKEFPYSDEKTADELAWARYMTDAYALAGDAGVDFEALLAAIDEEAEMRLPSPAGYFGH